MTDAELLKTYLTARRAPQADTTAIDAAIFARFGQTQAVMFTDLVGFSRMVEAFGIVHFLQLIDEALTVFEPLIQRHGGTCLKHEGDSLLALFGQPEAALAAARAMVQATQALNPGRSDNERIEVCIGLGYGTVLRIGTDEVWGAPVNAASKLGEEMAKGGEILVTQDFHHALHGPGFVQHATLFGTQKVFRLLEP